MRRVLHGISTVLRVVHTPRMGLRTLNRGFRPIPRPHDQEGAVALPSVREYGIMDIPRIH